MADGPQGVRINLPRPRGTNAPPGGAGGSLSWLSGMIRSPSVPTTAFPSGVALAATWNPDLMQQVGQVVGEEARTLNKDMMLAPCVNIQRTPFGGRNFESYSEDRISPRGWLSLTSRASRAKRHRHGQTFRGEQSGVRA